jgi:hypothetical protein
MITLEITSWNKGLKVVSLIEAVKEFSTGSLISAKAEVERLLGGESVKLEFDSESKREQFKMIAQSLGANCSK